MITRRQLLRAAAGTALLPLVARTSQAQTPAAATPAAGTLGAIRAVTITAARLDEVEAAWTTYMGYRVVSRGKIPKAMAKSWGAPKLAGKGIVILGPASGEPTYLRFVEQETPEGFDASKSWGWRATEITVQNSDELYQRLQNSPFKTGRPPSIVPTYPYLKAMGAVGPAGERLNLTWITQTRPDLAVAKSFVGRCFIATQTTPDLPAALEFYRSSFGNEPSPIRKLPNFELAVVKLNDGAKIEVDKHQGEGRPRERVPGGLPPGLAMVTFECTSFDRMTGKLISKPVKNEVEPFVGHRAGTLTGPAGELIELLDMK